ncbi:TPA: rod shape-determining protein [Candidatus Poribacteria bacterium]|nr:rod shape-determining protein [Candidatus Poribacteria bacterium]
MIFDSFWGLFSNDIAIDLGTATTLVYVRGKGIVLCEPSVVAVDKNSRRVIAVGNEAKQMLGKTPINIEAIRPLRDGVIADFDITESMIRHFIRKVHNSRRMSRPRMIIGIPSGITEVERRAVRESAERAGAREVYLITEPMAAAIGAGLPVQEPAGNMVVDIGGGTTEVAIISLGGIVVFKSSRIAGDELDEAIVQYIKREYSMSIGERSAEEIKIKIGSAFPLDPEETIELKGQDLVAGLPKTLTVSSQEIRAALKEPVSEIIFAIRQTLEKTPPELAADIVERGMILTGGGALLRGLDQLISEETKLPVFRAERSIECVVLGAGRALEELDKLRGVLASPGPGEH